MKELVKTRLPGMFDLLVRAGSSATSRTLRALPALPAENRLIRRNLPYFAVDIAPRMGMGALMSHAVSVLHHCALHGLTPRLIFTDPVYAPAPGSDWLDHYFVRKGKLAPHEASLPSERFVPLSINLYRRLRPSMPSLTLWRAHVLFAEHLGIRGEIHQAVDAFCVEQGIGLHTVGVHFRGTDKRYEADRVAWETVAAAVEARLGASFRDIFVATDEPAFLDFMIRRFGAAKVKDLGCKEIFPGAAPSHLTPGDPATKASEALRSMLVLARCGVLVRTRSHLSAWAKILNPQLPLVVLGDMLQRNRAQFPENLLAR